jgi:hypothetical protein
VDGSEEMSSISLPLIRMQAMASVLNANNSTFNHINNTPNEENITSDASGHSNDDLSTDRKINHDIDI